MSNKRIITHYGTKGMQWGVRKKSESHASYMKKERAYETLNIAEGKKLPKNWKKKMADVDANQMSKGKQAAVVALGVIGMVAFTAKLIKG